MVAQRDTPAPAHVHPQQGTGHCVEACRKDDRVQLELAIARADAASRDRLDRSAVKVDELDVRLVEARVVPRVDAHPLRAYRVRARAQQLCRLWIVDDLADLAAHELGDDLVRLGVQHRILEGREDGDAARRPALLERLTLLLRRQVGCAFGHEATLIERQSDVAESRDLAEAMALAVVRVASPKNRTSRWVRDFAC